ncbi:MAG TPA: alpha-amylase family glycosyl hydrolase, partial [Flavobacterium sp.]|nr:alpha-amylase family glycosyl hydrolase [Flavobacterium sp.]
HKRQNPAGITFFFECVRDFGADDDTSVEYRRDNDFYYIPGVPFEVPTSDSYRPLGGESNPLVDVRFSENPAKWTGNGSRLAKPNIDDWYETVKINYGIRPDGSKDFPSLPADFDRQDYRAHAAFWNDKDVPSSWKKFRDIALYWIGKGVDGFRYDMAEMVPYEFWSYMNSSIKMKNPNAFLMAEVYNPQEYRNYLRYGLMDYLYDKVEFYDTLKAVIQGKALPDGLSDIQHRNVDIEHHMLHFLDNHDEQRLASADFAGTPEKGKPLMVVSATISTSPTMVYFGQEVGEPGHEKAGFGNPTRTSIFDYVGVPHHQRWMNGGKFDGGQLSQKEKDLRDFYKRLLNFTLSSKALTGAFREIQGYNRAHTADYDPGLYSYVRWAGDERLIIVANFSWLTTSRIELRIPAEIIREWGLADGTHKLKEQLYGGSARLVVRNGEGTISLEVAPSESLILKLLP